jgi:hypothetical protein
MLGKPLKPKRCKICGQEFAPRSSTQKVCSYECATTLASQSAKKRQEQQQKAERQLVKSKLDSLKTKRDLTKDAQRAFNAYIRERDKDKPCICCGLPLATTTNTTGGIFDCGHYRSVGSAPHLRFDERNAHGQRKKCNMWGAGRAVDYRIGLINRIGLQAVEALEADQAPKKYTKDELKAIQAHYKAKLKELKNEN